MKKIKLLSAVAFIAISMASCKKDRTCECTYSSTSSSSVHTSSTVINKTKKSEAKTLCQKTTSSYSDSNGTDLTISDCKLK